jgi:hypothetical protein
MPQCRMPNVPKAKVPLPVRAARVLAKLKSVRGLTVAEKSVHALGIAATPQERWELFEQRARLFGFWKRSKRKKIRRGSS